MMRHAESEDAVESSARDHDRQITAAGRQAAQQVGTLYRVPAERALMASGSLMQSSLVLSAGPTYSQWLSPNGDTHNVTDGTCFDAPSQVAQQLADLGWVADLVICSDSTRTRQTLEAMQEARVGLEVIPFLSLDRLQAVQCMDVTEKSVCATCSCVHRPVPAAACCQGHLCNCVTCMQDARVHLRGDLYTIAALDGQTRSHLQVRLQTHTSTLAHFSAPTSCHWRLPATGRQGCDPGVISKSESTPYASANIQTILRRASLQNRRQGLMPGASLPWGTTRVGARQLPAWRWVHPHQAPYPH